MLSQVPNHSPLTISEDEKIDLKIGFEDENPSEVRVLVNDEEAKRTELKSEAAEWEFEFSRDEPGEYHVEVIVEGTFPDRLEHLYEQDALEFNDTEAHAEWVVIVLEVEDQQSIFGRIWTTVKEILAILSLAQVLNRLNSVARNESKEKDSNSSKEPNTTLDDFIDEDYKEENQSSNIKDRDDYS